MKVIIFNIINMLNIINNTMLGIKASIHNELNNSSEYQLLINDNIKNTIDNINKINIFLFVFK